MFLDYDYEVMPGEAGAQGGECGDGGEGDESWSIQPVSMSTH